jgi:hypothetical protein
MPRRPRTPEPVNHWPSDWPGKLGPDSPLPKLGAPTRKYTRKEAPVQRNVATFYGSLGMTVYQNSVFGVQPKGVTPGIPDLHPKWPEYRWEFDHEVKAEGYRMSFSQDVYLQECIAMETIYVVGGMDSAVDFVCGFLALGKPVGDTVQLFDPGVRRRNMQTAIEDPAFLARLWYDSPYFDASMRRYGFHG